MDRLGKIHAILEELDTTCVSVMGDFNANITKNNSVFGQHMEQFCRLNKYVCSSRQNLPHDTYTYVSDAWGTTSWLDHCISTQDAHSSICGMYVLYGFVQSDHIPFVTEFDVSLAPCVGEGISNTINPRITWSKLSDSVLDLYCSETDEGLRGINVPVDALLCKDVLCKDSSHICAISTFYENIVKVLIDSYNKTIPGKTGRKTKNCSGWNDYVADLHQVARDAFLSWRDAGSPRQGQLSEIKNRTRARFKAALRSSRRMRNR